MTAECPDPSDSRIEQLKSLTFTQLEDLAKGLLDTAEAGMKVIELLEKNTEVKTKMLRVGITSFINLIKDVSVEYEGRVKEGPKRN